MRPKINKLEKIFVGMVILILTLGLGLHQKLQKSININKETIVSKVEKEYINKFIQENKNLKETEEKYLRYLKNEQEVGTIHNIARIKYFLGINKYLNTEYESAIKYFEDAKKEFITQKNYFYILDINNYFMQIFFAQKNYSKVIKIHHETYELIKSEDIKGIESNELNKIKINTITELLKVSSSLGMMDISDVYYQELVELTNKTQIKTCASVFAKYFYNLQKGDFILAEKYAKEYIQRVENLIESDVLIVRDAYLSLLDVYIKSEQFEKAKEPFKILENICKKTCNDKDNSKIKGSLLMAEGIYLEKQKSEFYKAMDFYKRAMKEFEKINDRENILHSIEHIVALRDYVDVDLQEYIKKASVIHNKHNNEKLISELADILNTISRNNVKEEQLELIEQSKINNKVVKISNFMGLIYISIIILLILLTKSFRKEVLKRKKKENEIRKLSKYDSLTKAYSKEYIFEKINNYIQTEQQFTFVLVDIDDLKKINDTYGYSYADEVLGEVAKVIEESIIEFGYVGRFGGDEFIIVLKKNVNTRLILSLMRDRVNKRKYGLEKIKVTVSAGAIKWNEQTVDQLMAQADTLVREAKQNGKDKFIIK